MANTVIQARVSKSATFNGASYDVSALTEFYFKLRVNSITAGKRVLIELQSSTDAFTNKVTHWAKSFRGALPTEGQVDGCHSRKFLMAPIGVGSGVMRVAITAIDSGTTVNYEAWVENPV